MSIWSIDKHVIYISLINRISSIHCKCNFIFVVSHKALKQHRQEQGRHVKVMKNKINMQFLLRCFKLTLHFLFVYVMQKSDFMPIMFHINTVKNVKN